MNERDFYFEYQELWFPLTAYTQSVVTSGVSFPLAAAIWALSSRISSPPTRRPTQVSFQAQQQAVGHVVMVLQQQLQEKDRIIADLRAQLAALQTDPSG